MIEAASVQWVSGQMLGLAFFRMTETERQRFGQVIRDLTESEALETRDEAEPTAGWPG